jgi:DNA-directed RNA polymerase subunit RPC12/RpoP
LIALFVGTVLALVALSFVLYPLFVGGPLALLTPPERVLSATATRRNAAMEALREIEFDRETGKLSDADYETLCSTYTQRAVDLMRAGDAPACPRCGPRPERDAMFCSTCGAPIAA